MKTIAREESRPTGMPPVIEQRSLDVWLVLSHEPFFDQACNELGLENGPEVTWESGWDLSRSDHATAFFEAIQACEPSLLIFKPRLDFWALPTDRESGDWKLLSTIGYAIYLQTSAGRR
jgi:hypothetical protein